MTYPLRMLLATGQNTFKMLSGAAMLPAVERPTVPRFYFDFEIEENCYSDDRGVELESLEIARRATMRILPALVRDELTVVDFNEVRLRIRDEAGKLVWTENISRKDFELHHLKVGQSDLHTSGSH